MNRELLFIRYPVTGGIVVLRLNGSIYEPIMAFANRDALDFFVESGGDFLELLDRIGNDPRSRFLPIAHKAIDLSDIPAVFLDGWE